MFQIQKNKGPHSNWKLVMLNVLALLVILAVLFLIRAPLLINADFLVTLDEADQGSQIIDLMKGGPIFFYFEAERYAGIFLGLAAIPFFWILGLGGLAYKIPAVIAHAGYVLSAYWIVRKIHPPAALIAAFLMIFVPYPILYISTHNWQHNLAYFLGNLVFLLFIKSDEVKHSGAGIIFMLGVAMGAAVYTYTYSVLYCATVAVLFVLVHEKWSLVRDRISFEAISTWWRGEKLKKKKLVRVLDVIIYGFAIATLFSYVFGGFGIDVMGYSIFQINNLHKPVTQVLVLIFIRVLIYRDDITLKLGFQKIYSALEGIIPMRIFCLGILGMVIGLLPRFGSILMGETTRGGQGFDVNFDPIKIIVHLWHLVSFQIPELLELRTPFVQLFNAEWSLTNVVRAILAASIFILVVKSVIHFIAPRWTDIKAIFQLKKLKFEPGIVLIVFFIFLCSAAILSQNGVKIRHLIPIHGLVSIWVAIYLADIRLKSETLYAGLLTLWCTFGVLNVYYFYTAPVAKSEYAPPKLVEGFKVIRHPNRYANLLKYCKEKGIKHVYSPIGLSWFLNFHGKGAIIAAGYQQESLVRRTEELLSSEYDFALIISGDKDLNTFKNYLKSSSIKYTEEFVDNQYWVLNNLVGEPQKIDGLRDLIPWHR